MTDIGKLNIEYLLPPAGIVYEFTTYLASNACRIGNRSALGFYLQEEMEQMATEFIDLNPVRPENIDDLYAWIRELPWPESGRLAFAFNW